MNVRKKLLRSLVLIIAVIGTTAVGPRTWDAGAEADQSITGRTYSFINGRWFDGSGFTKKTWYAVQGKLTQMQPAGPIETIDLADSYIVPPFGEAHNHNIEGEWNVEAIIARYLNDGVFCVKNPNDVRDLALKIRDKVNSPQSIDVAFAHAGLTGSGGHPIALYEDILRRHRYEPVTGPLEHGWFENRAYVVVNTEQDFHDKWPLITDGKPDFLKAYLAHSEDRPAEATVHHGQGAGKARSGLNPALLPAIVAKAHESGLRVTVHVETAADFRIAVREGADEIAHLPGWLIETQHDVERARLTEADAQLAARTGVVVVTTTVAGEAIPGHVGDAPHSGGTGTTRVSSLRATARNVQRDNLRLLHEYGVKLAVGSDHAETSLAEVLTLKALHLFDNLTLLKLWCEATPAAIFPGRRIGRFAEGYEASFVALSGDPTRDFEHVKAIRLRVKQGVRLDAPRQ
jgi:hypothetical protein